MIEPSPQIASLRARRRRMQVRAALTRNLHERELLQASVTSVTNDIARARNGHPFTAAAGPVNGFDGAALVLVADNGEVTYADGDSAPLHCTVCYLGDADDLDHLDRKALRGTGETLASSFSPFTPTPLSPARFGDDDVLLVEHPDIQRAHDIALTNRRIALRTLTADAHPHYIPHVSGATTAPTFDRVGVWLGEDRQEFPFTRGVTAGIGRTISRFVEALHPRGNDGEWIKKFGLVDLTDMPGFRHGQRGDKDVQGEVVDIIPDPDKPDNPIIRVKVTDPRWDAGQFGETFDARRYQVAGRKKPKAKLGGDPAPAPPQVVTKSAVTGTIPARTPLPGYTANPVGPHLQPLQPPLDWVSMGEQARRQWVTDTMQADYQAFRGKPTMFDFSEFDSGISMNLANTYRELTNWDPDTAMRIDRAIVPPKNDPDGQSMGATAIAVARPGTAHPGGIGPKIKESGIVLKPSYFADMDRYKQQKKMSDNSVAIGKLPYSTSSHYADPTVTLAHEFAHQRQFRFLDIAMREVNQAWSPIVREDGFGLVPDSSNWVETQTLRYQIAKLTPTEYGQSKSSEGFAEAWAARGTGWSTPELNDALDQWDAYMALPLSLPPDRYTTTTNFDDATLEEKADFWQSAGPMLELPGMRDHYPEAAAEYDAWLTGKPVQVSEPVVVNAADGSPISAGQTVNLAGDTYTVTATKLSPKAYGHGSAGHGDSPEGVGPIPQQGMVKLQSAQGNDAGWFLADAVTPVTDQDQGEAAMTFAPAEWDAADPRSAAELQAELARLDAEHDRIEAEQPRFWRHQLGNIIFERHIVWKQYLAQRERERRQQQGASADWDEGEAAMEVPHPVDKVKMLDLDAYVAHRDGKPVGVLTTRNGQIELIYVRPEYRRQGVANELQARAEQDGPLQHSESRTPLGEAWARSHGQTPATDRSDPRQAEWDGEDALDSATKLLGEGPAWRELEPGAWFTSQSDGWRAVYDRSTLSPDKQAAYAEKFGDSPYGWQRNVNVFVPGVKNSGGVIEGRANTLEQAQARSMKNPAGMDKAIEKYDATMTRMMERHDAANAARAAVETVRDEIEQAHPGVTLELSQPADDIWRLSSIKVPADGRGQGAATAALTDLLARADAEGVTVSLTPERIGDTGLSVAQLRAWYTRYGFVPNKGSGRVLETTDSMIRFPQQAVVPGGLP